MNIFKTKIYFCECMNPKCNITVYTYEEQNDTVIVMPVFCSIKYPAFNKQIFNILFKPIKIFYRIYHYLFKDIYAYPDVCLIDCDITKIKKLLPETICADGYFDNYYIVPKKDLNMCQKFEYIVNNELSLTMTIENFSNEITYDFE